MRVIAGSARRIQLSVPQGRNTRPTSDRIKETLFNILQDEIEDAVFLDIFSGSGGIGIEAVSRGAQKAVLIENDRNAIMCIKENIRRTRLEEKVVLHQAEVMQALRHLECGTDKFSMVFMDPPYNKSWELKVLHFLRHADILAEDALLIVEASMETDVEPIAASGYALERVKEYKTSKHIFLRKAM